MEKEVEIVTINNNDYAILKEITYKDNDYLYLSNLKDAGDTMIRKLSKDNKELIVPLESDEEFDLACALIFKKNK